QTSQQRGDMSRVPYAEDHRDKLSARRRSVVVHLREDRAFPTRAQAAPPFLGAVEAAAIALRTNDQDDVGCLDLAQGPTRPPFRRRPDILIEVGIDTVASQA